MNIALYGTGKMGQAIAQVARQRGHTIGLEVHAANAGSSPKGMDVAIEFSRPEHAVANIRLCVEAGVPVVVGTTGWYDHLHQVQQLVAEKKGSVLWASNFSIGVNLFFRVNRLLAQLMDTQTQYHVHLDEIHHIHKLDAPSGTAITLARDIDLRTQRYSGWKLKEQEQPLDGLGGTNAPVPIYSERTGDVPGKHSVSWTSAADRIIITHEAFGRTGFATGAVLAAEWLSDPVQKRQGLFTMEDVLG